MPTNLSAQLNASPQKRHLLYLAATIVTMLLIGYHFGTFDEAMHIPFLKASVHPGLLIFMKVSAMLTLTAFPQDDVVLVMITNKILIL